MVKHVVMFKLKDYPAFNERQFKLMTIKQELDGLKDKINVIQSFEIGINFNITPNAFDIVLVSEFENISDLNKYQEHPEHVRVVEIIKASTVSAAVSDYLI